MAAEVQAPLLRHGINSHGSNPHVFLQEYVYSLNIYFTCSFYILNVTSAFLYMWDVTPPHEKETKVAHLL